MLNSAQSDGQGHKLHDLFPVFELILADKKVRAKIDTVDLPKVLSASLHWNAFWHPGSKTYYVYTETNGRRLYLHRVVTDSPRGLVVDHRKHDGLDNRRSLLRVVVQGENVRNSRRKPGKYGRGISWYSPAACWRARTKVAGREIHLGYFSRQEDAVAKVREFLANRGIDIKGEEQ